FIGQRALALDLISRSSDPTRPNRRTPVCPAILGEDILWCKRPHWPSAGAQCSPGAFGSDPAPSATARGSDRGRFFIVRPLFADLMLTDRASTPQLTQKSVCSDRLFHRSGNDRGDSAHILQARRLRTVSTAEALGPDPS